MSTPWHNDRYQMLGRLGRGSFAEVFLVFDRVCGHEVALKLMHQTGDTAIAELTREFRALRSVDHPNVVALHELHVDGDHSFLTMEAVRGVSLSDHAREIPEHERHDRVMDVLAQLAEGIAALHQHGVLHRDLKPSNVRVSDEGRVVLLDAGLAKHLESQRSGDHYVVGTLAYMSPEQAMAEKLDAASDWYSFGLIAFELLTGRPVHDPQTSPLTLVGPQRLAPSFESCARAMSLAHPETAAMIDLLLAPTRSERPGIEKIRQWLSARADTSPWRRLRLAGEWRRAPLLEGGRVVGRDHELAQLDLALSRARRGHPMVVRIEGESGLGKSALLRQWLTGAAALECQVHFGRCYQGELVPFSGLDEILQGLFPTSERETAPTLDAAQIAVMRTLLGERAPYRPAATPSVESLWDRADGDQPLPPDNLVRRRLLGQAIFKTMTTLAAGKAVLIAIDDAQWAAPETVALMADLLRADWPETFTLVVSLRTDEDGHQAWRELGGEVIEVVPLSTAAARQLVESISGPTHEHRDRDFPLAQGERTERVLRDARGHPLLLALFAAFASRRHHGELTLAGLVDDLWQDLDVSQQTLLTTIAAAFGTVPTHVILAASRVDAPTDQLRALFALGLVRRVGRTGTRLVIAHDRIGMAIAARVPDMMRACHLALARVLETTPGVDPELPVSHHLAAGADAQTTGLIIRAARHLRDTLAFSRAAQLYRVAIAFLTDTSSPFADLTLARELELELVEVLIAARRNLEAARLLQALAKEGDRPTLIGRAAIELIRVGHIDEGFELAREVLNSLGVKVSKRRMSVLPLIAWHRLRLALRGDGFRLRRPEEVPSSLLRRADWCQGLGTVLSVVDTMKGFQVHNQGLLAALAAGEPARLSRALAMEAGFRMAIASGRDPRGKVRRLLETARVLAQGSRDPRSIGVVDLMEGSTRWAAGDWEGTSMCIERGLSHLQRHCQDIAWEVNFGQSHLLDAISWLGRMREHRRRLEAELADAHDRSDLYAQTLYTVRDLPTARLVEDRVDEARACSEALTRWVNRGFQVEHMADLYQQTDVDLYRGRGLEAYERVCARWGELTRHQLMSVAAFRVEMKSLFGRAILGAFHEASPSLRQHLKRRLVRLAHELVRERESVRRDVFAAVVIAGAEQIRGRPEEARLALEAGCMAADKAGMQLHKAALSIALGRVVGGDEGQSLQSGAIGWMRSEGFVRPERYAPVLGPWFVTPV